MSKFLCQFKIEKIYGLCSKGEVLFMSHFARKVTVIIPFGVYSSSRSFSHTAPILAASLITASARRIKEEVFRAVPPVQQPHMIAYQESPLASRLFRDDLSALAFTFRQLIGAHTHLGHRVNSVDSRGMEGLLGERNGFYVINLLKTIFSFKSAANVITSVVSKRGKVVFSNLDKFVVSTLPDYVKQFSLRYSIAKRKLPGILTNFIFTRRNFADFRHSCQIPSFALAFTSYDHHILREADILNLPSLGIFDSDTNPIGHAFYAAPGNDDSFFAKLFYTRLFFRALHTGHRVFLLGWLRRKTAFLKRTVKSFRYFFYRKSNFFEFYDYLSNFYWSNFITTLDQDHQRAKKHLRADAVVNYRSAVAKAREFLSAHARVTTLVGFNYRRLLFTGLFFKSKFYQFLSKFADGKSPIFFRGLVEENTDLLQIFNPHASMGASGYEFYHAFANKTVSSTTPPPSLRSLDFIFDDAQCPVSPYNSPKQFTLMPIYHKLNSWKFMCFDFSWLSYRIDNTLLAGTTAMLRKTRIKFLNYLTSREIFTDSLYVTYRTLLLRRISFRPKKFLYVKRTLRPGHVQ